MSKIIKPNWEIFKAKFSENPQETFEWFCYLLFNREFKKEKGVPKNKNQSAIETNPINYNGEVIGWQSKFYQVSLSTKKNEILETLRKSKRYYPTITKIIFYTNSEFGQGRKGDKPQAQIDAEDLAKELSIELEWRTKSFFESEFVTLKSSDISSYFFILEKIAGTDQILDQDDFIKSYGSNKLSTPLDNWLCCRENLVQEIVKSIESNQVTILTGNAGVGKTKVALESLKTFEDRYITKAVYHRGKDLYDELRELFKYKEKYILLVDDSNRNYNLNYFEDFLKEKKSIKVILTVRDYAKDSINGIIKKFNSRVIKVEPLEDSEIKKLFKTELPPHITDTKLEHLTDIVKGNPRLAYMIILSNKFDEYKNITVEDIYNRYFESLEESLSSSNNSNNLLKVAFIISFFRNLIKHNQDFMSSIYRDIEIDEVEFWQLTEELNQLEIVDLYESDKGLVKFSEQIFGDYIFYHTIVNTKNISTGLLFKEPFISSNRLFESINSLIRIYGHSKVVELLEKPFKEFLESDSKLKIHIVKELFFISPMHSLYIINSDIENGDISTEHISTLVNFYHLETKYFKQSITLLFKIFEKNKQQTEAITSSLKEIAFHNQDIKSYVEPEKLLFQLLINKTESGQNRDYSILFIELSKHFLRTEFWNTSIKNYTFTSKYFSPNYNKELKGFRDMIFLHLFRLYRDYKSEVQLLLYEYSDNRHFYTNPQIKIDTIRGDSKILMEFISKEFDYKDYREILIVDKLYRKHWKKSVVDKRVFKLYNIDKFLRNQTLRIYNIMTINPFRLKRFKEFESLEKNKGYISKSLNLYFKNLKPKQIKNCFINLKELLENIFVYEDWVYKSAIESIFDSIFKNHKDSYIELFRFYKQEIEERTLYNFFTISQIIDILGYQDSLKLLIEIGDYDLLRSYYFNLPKEQIDQEQIESFLELYKNEKISLNSISLYLKKYYDIDNSFVVRLIGIVIDKEYYQYELEMIFYQFTNYKESMELFSMFSSNIKLFEKLYLKILVLKEFFDYKGHYLNALIDKDSSFAYKFIENHLKIKKDSQGNNFHIIWNREEYQELIEFLIETHWKQQKDSYSMEELTKYFFLTKEDQVEKEKKETVLKKLLIKHISNFKFIYYLFSNLIAYCSQDVRVNLIIELIKNRFSIDNLKPLELYDPMMFFSEDPNDKNRVRYIPEYQRRIEFLKEAKTKIEELEESFKYIDFIDFFDVKIEKNRNGIERDKRELFLDSL